MHIIFALNLLLLAGDQLVAGFAGALFPRQARHLYHWMFGAVLPDDPVLDLLLRPWGALGFFAGLVTLLPLYDSTRYRAVLAGLATLLFLRLYIRLRFARSASETIRLAQRRNALHVGLILTSLLLTVWQFLTTL